MIEISDILNRMDALANYRQTWEQSWSDIATYCLSDAQRFYPGSSAGLVPYDQFALGPVSIERGRQRFDDTALRAVDRLGSGIESLVTPQSGKWHGLALSNPFAPEPSDEEKEYLERYRDYMFAMRYNAKSGFIGAHQKALRSAIALGTGVIYVEESGTDDIAVPALYRHLPLSGCYIAVNAQGEPDTLYRRFQMTARQMVQRFGEDVVAAPVLRAYQGASTKDQQFTIIHAVEPRKECGDAPRGTTKAAPWASYWVDKDNNMILGESGFYEFPFVVYYWQPVEEEIPYAQSPIMMAMSEIKGLNAMRKASLKGLQSFFDPAWATAHDGIMNRLNINPGKINYGAMDAQGRLKAQPLITMTRPDFAIELLKAERDGVNDSLYINLFQVILNHPDMTATEALIRANEKGELLGPAGSKIQSAMAHMVERETGIIIRKGAMRPGAALAPPESMAGKGFHVAFTSPLDRLRRAQEGIGIQRSLQTALPLMQVDPSVADNFDFDELVRTVNEIEGAPQKILARIEQRDAKRASRQQQQQIQQTLEAAKTGGEAAKNIVPAMQGMQQLAGLPSQPPPTGARPS